MSTLIYKAYSEGNDLFKAKNRTNIPKGVEVKIIVEDDEDVKKRKKQALDKLFAAINAIEDEPITDEDLAVLEHNRVNFYRELGI